MGRDVIEFELYVAIAGSCLWIIITQNNIPLEDHAHSTNFYEFYEF